MFELDSQSRGTIKYIVGSSMDKLVSTGAED